MASGLKSGSDWGRIRLVRTGAARPPEPPDAAPTPLVSTVPPAAPADLPALLAQALSAAGVEDLQVRVLPVRGGVHVIAEIRRDRRGEMEAYLRENLRAVIFE